jgi:hypothetical protein
LPQYNAARKHDSAVKDGSEHHHERITGPPQRCRHADELVCLLFASIAGLVICQIDIGDRGPITNLKNILR